MNMRVRAAVAAHGGAIVGEEYFPVDHGDMYIAQIQRGRMQVIENLGAIDPDERVQRAH